MNSVVLSEKERVTLIKFIENSIMYEDELSKDEYLIYLKLGGKRYEKVSNESTEINKC